MLATLTCMECSSTRLHMHIHIAHAIHRKADTPALLTEHQCQPCASLTACSQRLPAGVVDGWFTLCTLVNSRRQYVWHDDVKPAARLAHPHCSLKNSARLMLQPPHVLTPTHAKANWLGGCLHRCAGSGWHGVMLTTGGRGEVGVYFSSLHLLLAIHIGLPWVTSTLSGARSDGWLY